MRSPCGSNIPSAWHLLYLLSVTSVSCNSESPVPLTRTTWKAYHGDTGAGATYESPPPTSTWPHRAFCGDTDLLESVTFVCTDWEEAIVEACPPPDSGRGRGPTETSGRKTTQETLGGAGVSGANGVLHNCLRTIRGEKRGDRYGHPYCLISVL